MAASSPSPGSRPRTVADHDRRVEAGVAGDLAERLLEGPADDLRAGRLVGRQPRGLDRRLGVQQRDAAAGEDPLVERRTGRLDRVLDPVHALGQLGLGGGADADHGDLTAQPGHALAELVAVVLVEVAVLLELGANLPDPPLDRLRVAAAADDRGRLPVDHDALRPPELPELDVVQREAELLRDVRPAGEDRQVLVHARVAAAPYSGVGTATDVTSPRSLLTTSVASASPAMCSPRISSGFPVGISWSSSGRSSSAVLSRSPEMTM